MNAQEFVDSIKKSAPSVEDYLKQGFDERFAIKSRRSFIAPKKKESTGYQDELLQLIECYDASNLVIGQIKFFDRIKEKPNYYLVGEVEADWLVVNKITGMLEVIELYSEKNLWYCAVNGSKFLEAISMANIFFVTRSSDDNLFNDQKITCNVAEECSMIAGSERFLEFYKMLLGCFE